VSRSSRYLAFLSYLLSLPGALFVLIVRRDDPFAVFHAWQSLRLVIIAVAAPLIWAVAAWILAWIPLIGGMLGVVLFALVIATHVGILISWIAGMINSLKGKVQPLPFLGAWAASWGTAPAVAESAITTEPIERTTTIDA
jgi:uncharacterized membrane protein